MRSLLRRLYRRLLADSEADTDGKGYLSHRAETHAAAWGLGCGILFGVTGERWILTVGVLWLFTRDRAGDAPAIVPYPRQFARESGYVIGHTAVGIVIGLGIDAFL